MTAGLRTSPHSAAVFFQPCFGFKIVISGCDVRFRKNSKLLRRNVEKRAGAPRLRLRISRLEPVHCSSSLKGVTSIEDGNRPPFDLHLAVLLAGFAFESYNSPPEKVGRREMDSADCQTVFLSETFLRELYDGQLFIKLKKGSVFPAMDPWGTSDPYIVFNLDGQVVKSGTKWGSKDPTWNENYTLNVNTGSSKFLQVAAWDANLVTPHKRIGNSGIDVVPLFDGKVHELEVELGGIGGGGRVHLEVHYKSFDELDKEKTWWSMPFVSELFTKSNLGSALKTALGTESIYARQFVQFAFGQLKSLNDAYFHKDTKFETIAETKEQLPLNILPTDDENSIPETDKSSSNSLEIDKFFWEKIFGSVDEVVNQKHGFSLPNVVRWETFDLLNRIGLQSQKSAEQEYIKSGLASPDGKDGDSSTDKSTPDESHNSKVDIKKASWDILSHTDSILGAIMLVNSAFSRHGQEGDTKLTEQTAEKNDDISSDSEQQSNFDVSALNKREEEIKALFTTAESAMEAWALLSTSLGRSSFIKSEFEKICFIENFSSDTQLSLWRDLTRQRLVIAFRGTEQSKLKDLQTDLMLAPSGFNPERISGNFKEEVQVHSGFLGAYDSVRNRIMTLIKHSIGFCEDSELETIPKWNVFVTGHSLGGALATLLAFELSCSQMAKRGMISITMYNFGSPRVGNRCFTDMYNQKVKDSWRVVNHRDIIPTVPRLMGYCHVAQPVYLAAGDLDNLVNFEALDDDYEGDVIGESTPDSLVSEFMRGEMQLIEKILQTEINMFRSIRDGTALMQHMEDFYYVSLLEKVKSNYASTRKTKPKELEA